MSEWEIKYRIVGDNSVRTIIKDLHFETKHEVGEWFKRNNHDFSGKRNVEFINAKIKE